MSDDEVDFLMGLVKKLAGMAFTTYNNEDRIFLDQYEWGYTDVTSEFTPEEISTILGTSER